MNSLSWLIYLAGVFDSLSMAFGILSVVLLIGLVFYSIFATMCASIDDDEFRGKIAPAKYFAVVLAGLLLSSFIPDKKTVYAIAASQLGERVLKTETAQGLVDDATKALQFWIKRQIEEQPTKK